MCGWKVSVDDALQRHGTSSQTGPASTPEAIQDQQSSGGPSEKYQWIGAVELLEESCRDHNIIFDEKVEPYGDSGRPGPDAASWSRQQCTRATRGQRCFRPGCGIGR
jgi:hypothetical protein